MMDHFVAVWPALRFVYMTNEMIKGLKGFCPLIVTNGGLLVTEVLLHFVGDRISPGCK